MAKLKVLLSLKDAPQRVQLMGRVFLSADMVNPIRDPAAVRKTLPYPCFLEPGSYAYVFDVRGAGGAFTVEASGSGVGSALCDTTDGTVGRVLSFKVRAVPA